MIYDAVVCAGPQHQHVAALAIKSLQRFSEPGKIYVITAAGNFEYFQKLKRQGLPINMIDEDKLIEGVNLGCLKEYFVQRGAGPARAGWYFQQFLKMSICYHPDIADHFLIWDSDTIMLQPLSFSDSEGRILVNPYSQFHKPYFDLIEKFLDIESVADFSFISEHMMVNKKYMRKLIEEIEEKSCGKSWPLTILDLVEDVHLGGSGFSEFETYGNYIHQHNPGCYRLRELRSLRSGSKHAGYQPGRSDLYLLSREYAYASFEVWTRFSTWKRTLWKLKAVIYLSVAHVIGLFSREISGRLKTIADLFH